MLLGILYYDMHRHNRSEEASEETKLDSSTLLIIVFAVAALGLCGILLSIGKSAGIRRFTKKHPDAVWVLYSGPKDSRVTYDNFETGTGMSFDFGPEKRGILVSPGEIRLKISYAVSTNEDAAFTQILQFTAVKDKSYTLEVDESHRVMRVFSHS